MKANKKIMLGLGAITAVSVPVIAVVSCVNNSDIDKANAHPFEKMYRTYLGHKQIWVYNHLPKGVYVSGSVNDGIGNTEYGYWKDIE